MTFIRRRRIQIGATTGAALLVIGTATGAFAHVGVDPDTTDAESYAVLTFDVPHGCEESPTTEVAIEFPDDKVGPPTPTVNPNWDIHSSDEDENGPAEIVYTAKTPLDAHQRDTFEISVFILPETEGTDLVFPVTQTCEDDEIMWDETPEDGEDYDDLDLPAPMFTVTEAGAAAAGEDASDTDGADNETTADSNEAAPNAQNNSSNATTWAVSAFVLAAAALLISAFSLRNLRKTK